MQTSTHSISMAACESTFYVEVPVGARVSVCGCWVRHSIVRYLSWEKPQCIFYRLFVECKAAKLQTCDGDRTGNTIKFDYKFMFAMATPPQREINRERNAPEWFSFWMRRRKTLSLTRSESVCTLRACVCVCVRARWIIMREMSHH